MKGGKSVNRLAPAATKYVAGVLGANADFSSPSAVSPLQYAQDGRGESLLKTEETVLAKQYLHDNPTVSHRDLKQDKKISRTAEGGTTTFICHDEGKPGPEPN